MQLCEQKKDEREDKVMSVKKELDSFFERFMEAYQDTEDGLPISPRCEDIDQAVYVGEPDDSGWCSWKPIPYGEQEAFIRLLETYGIEKNTDIVDYFSSYHFLDIDIIYKKKGIMIDAVDPRDEYKSLKQSMVSFTYPDGKIPYLPIGTDEHTDLDIVVEVKTGIVKIVDFESGKMRKIAPSLEEFIRGWEPWVD